MKTLNVSQFKKEEVDEVSGKDIYSHEQDDNIQLKNTSLKDHTRLFLASHH